MKKIVILAILLAFSFSVLSCGGGSGSFSSPHGENPGTPTIVRLLPSHYIALTNSIITLHAKVLDGNGAPVKNVAVFFTNQSPTGTLSAATAKTNNSGIATVTIKATVAGFATVQAEVNKGVANVRDKKTVFFTSTLALSPFLVLDVDGNNNGIYNESSDINLFEGGDANDNQVIIRATVYNKFGERASGSTVTFGADSTEATFPNGTTATTDSSGEAFVLVKVTPMTVRDLQTVLNITASADNGAAGLVSLFLQPVTITGIDVTATPSVIAPSTQDNESTSTVSAAVKMLDILPVPDGSVVSFVASCGTVTPFGQTVNGVATATFTAPSTVPPIVPPALTPQCRVTATIAGLPSSITTNYADITVTTALSVQPTTQTVNGLTGGAVSYIITGGVGPYTVTSGNSNAACNSTDSDCADAEDSGTWIIDTQDASGNYSFTVTVPASTATQNVALTIKDTAAGSVNATLAISGTALSVQPGTTTIDGTTGGDVTFTIFGGVPGYDIFPNTADATFAPDTAHVANSGGTFKISVPSNSPEATIIYTVRDSAGSTTTGTLNVTASTIVPPVADFVGIPATGVAPLLVNFTDLSTGSPTSWAWSFGDGNSSAVQNPSNTYTNPGTYTVTLIATNAGGSDPVTKIGYITVTAPLSISGTVTTVDENATNYQALLFSVLGGTPGYTIVSSDFDLAFNDNGAGGGIANNGIRDGGEGGIWTLATPGPIVVTIPAGDIVPVAGDTVTLTVVDAAAGNASVDITINDTP